MVVVEGFFDCIAVHQAGFPCVALMGSSLSAEQEQLLCAYFTGAHILLDGDDAGRAAAADCLVRLGQKMWVKAVPLDEGKQPDMLLMDELKLLLQ